MRPIHDLADDEAQLLSTHVADCDECREKLELMGAVQDVAVKTDIQPHRQKDVDR